MGLTVFNQFPQLTRLLARIARVAAHKETACPFARINLIGGRGSLTDRAVNLVALSGDAATLALPELVPGESRHFGVRLEVAAETSVTFEGNEDFERDAADTGVPVSKVARGLSVTLPAGCYLYTFTETAPGVFLASRKVVEKIEEEE